MREEVGNSRSPSCGVGIVVPRVLKVYSRWLGREGGVGVDSVSEYFLSQSSAAPKLKTYRPRFYGMVDAPLEGTLLIVRSDIFENVRLEH